MTTPEQERRIGQYLLVEDRRDGRRERARRCEAARTRRRATRGRRRVAPRSRGDAGCMRCPRVSEIETLKVLPGGLLADNLSHGLAISAAANALSGAIVDFVCGSLCFRTQQRPGKKSPGKLGGPKEVVVAP